MTDPELTGSTESAPDAATPVHEATSTGEVSAVRVSPAEPAKPAARKRAPRAPTEKPTAESTRAEMQRLFDAEQHMDRELEETLTESADVEHESGEEVADAVLAGDGRNAAAAASMRVVLLREQAARLRDAIAALRRRRIAAWDQERDLRAEAKRARAAELRTAAGARAAHATALLVAIEEFEGVPYAPRPIDMPSMPLGAGGFGAMLGAFSPPTRTDRLRQEADQLEQQAAQIRSERMQRDGSAAGASAAELLIASSSTMRLGPVASDVHRWMRTGAARQIEKVLEGYRDSQSRELVRGWSVEYEIEWKDGALVESRCTAHPVRPAPAPEEGRRDGSPIESGRAPVARR